MSELPKFHEYLGPVLDALADGELTTRQVAEKVADAMGIPAEQRQERIPSGQTRMLNRVQWGLSYLGQALCVERPRRGVYRLTERGRELRAKHPDNLGLDELRAFPEFREFQARSGTRSTGHAATVSEEQLTPQERIASAVEQIESSVAEDLLGRVRQMEPEFLEKAVLQLLVAMGYGGSEGDAQHMGGPGDGGFDGVINQDRLGLERIYVQAKRYAPDNIVGRPAVQGFVGALHGMGAAGGVFMTTSRFSPDAVAFAEGIKPRVILIDGARLGMLMIKYGIGVQARQTYTLVEVDEEFFE